jgi:hypothetical protein
MPRPNPFAAAAVLMALVCGLSLRDAQARGAPRTTTLRMTAAGADAAAAGRMRFRTRHGATSMSATFRHLAPDTMHTVRWDVIAQDGPQFTTDHRGCARLRHMAVPDGAMARTPQMSVTDEDGDAVLTCDPDSMPGMHGDRDACGTTGGTACSQECIDRCASGGTCDAQCRDEYGCDAASRCGGMMDGSGTSDGSTRDTSGGTTGGGMMGGGMTGGGMMHR